MPRGSNPEFSLHPTAGASSSAQAVAMGDLDGDGDLDAFVANNATQGNQVYLNDGTGAFTAFGGALGNSNSNDVQLADFDGDGDLDAFVANEAQNFVWLNDGAGNFTQGQAVGNVDSRAVAIGDLDGDGDLDVFVANTAADRVYLLNSVAQNGAASDTFINNTQTNLDTAEGVGVVLYDFDGDNDLDAIVANNNASAIIFENDGAGLFTQVATIANTTQARDVQLVDFDGDNTPELYFSRDNGQVDTVFAWDTNTMSFIEISTTGLTAHNSSSASFADTNADGVIDLAVVTIDDSTTPANNGNIVYDVTLTQAGLDFAPRANTLGTARTLDAGLADFDADGDVDVFFARLNAAHDVWHLKLAPTATDDTLAMAEDDTSNVTAVSGVLANDTDPESFALGNVTLVTDVSHGALTLNADGSFTYAPTGDFFGEDSFSYTMTDGTQTSNTATVTITVANVNDAPVLSDDSDTIDEDDLSIITPTVSDVDNDTVPGTDTFTFTVTQQPMTAGGTAGDAGSASIIEGDLVYEPATDFNGTATVIYEVSDGNGGTDTATVTYTVNAINDAPVATDITRSVNEDTSINVDLFAATATELLGAAYDVDGDALTITIDVESDVSHGTTSVNGGVITYTPAANYNGADSLIYTVSDGNLTALGLIDFTVTPINDGAPTASGESYTTDEDTTLVANNVDIAGVLANDSKGVDANETLSVVLVNPPAFGTLNLNANGTFTYTPALHNHGATFFRYKVSDGQLESGTVTASIIINPVNDGAEGVNDTTTINEDSGATTINVLANDTDVDTDTTYNTAQQVDAPSFSVYSFNDTTTKGTLVDNGNGSFDYTPSLNENGADSFTYYVTDGNKLVDDSGSATGANTVEYVIQVPNDTTLAVDFNCTGDPIVKLFDDQLVELVASNDDGAGLCPKLITSVTAGEYMIQVGSFDSNPITFDIMAQMIDQASVTINITPINDDPVAAIDSFSTDEDTPISFDVTTNDDDVEGDTLTIQSCTQPTHGTTSDGNTPAEVLYSPNADYFGPDGFTCTITDGQGGTSIADVIVTVNPVNDAPVATADIATTNEDTDVTINVVANDTDVDEDNLSLVSCTQPANGAVVADAISPNTSVRYTPNLNFNGEDSFSCTITDGAIQDTATVTVTVNAVNDHPTLTTNPLTLTLDEDLSDFIALSGNIDDVEDDNLSLTITIEAPPAHGTAEVSSGQIITYAGNENYNGGDSFAYRVTDSEGGFVIGTVNVTVNAVNDAPVANDDTLTVAEDGSNSVNVTTNDTDVDLDNLTISNCGNGAHGAVTIEADNKTATYTSNDQDYNGDDSFTCTITDGALTDTAIVNVTVTPVNDAPVANSSIDETIAEDGDVTVSPVSVVTDVDGDDLSVTSCLDGADGSTTRVGTSDSFVYSPGLNFNGGDSFTCVVSDGQLTATVTVNVTVTPVNDDPTANDDAITVAEDSNNNTINVTLNDIDVDGDTPALTSCGQGSNGTTTTSGDVVTYEPNLNYYGSDSFTCTIGDGNGGSATSTVNVTIMPVNDEPTGVDDEYTCDEDTTLTTTYDDGDGPKGVLFNDDDVDNLPPALNYANLTVRLVTPPIAGNLTLRADGTFDYTPELNSNDNVAFVYELIDDTGIPTGDLYFAFITINPINDIPVAVNDGSAETPIEMNEDTTLTIDVIANDTDVANEGQTLTVVSVTQPANGTVTITNEGADVLYEPNGDYFGADSFTYVVSDGEANSATSATVFIQVNNVPDAPVAVDDGVAPQIISTDEETAIVLTVTTNDTDADGDSLSVVGLNGQPVGINTPTDVGDAIVTLESNSGFFTMNVVPKQDVYGDISFTYTVSDSDVSTADDEGTVFITVNNVNDAPVAADQSYGDGVEDNDYSLPAGALMVNAVDVDPNNTHTARLVDGSAVGGLATVNADGSFNFSPTQDLNGDVTFSYELVDQDGAVSNAATVTITLAPVNDAPVAVADASNEMDEEQTFVINPIANDTDVDGDELTLTGVVGVEPASAGNAVVINESGVLLVEFTAALDFVGPVTISYTVSDGSLDATGEISITVNNINDNPVAVNDVYADAVEDVIYTATDLLSVLANDSDVDFDDTLTASYVDGSATNGTVTLNGDGSFSFEPDADFNGDATFRYLVTDAAGASSGEGLVTLTFAPVNDAPRTQSDSFVGGTEEVTFTVATGNSILNNDVDVDLNNTFTAHLVPGSEVGGAATINADGSFSFEPAANFYGEASFQYVARDQDDADSDPTTVTITFSNTADAPVAVNDPAAGEEPEYVGNEDTTLTVNVGSGLLVNDFDVDNQPVSAEGLTASVVTEPTHGQVNLNDDGSFSYTPVANYNGPDSFTYQVDDGVLVSNQATVNLTVTAVNDAPVGVVDAFSTDEDQPLIIDAAVGLLINDTDIDDDAATLTAELVENTPLAAGVVAVEPNGSFTFAPVANFNGTTSFTYQAIDPSGARSELTTVTLTVNAVNDAPIAAADSYTVEEDRTLNVNAPGLRVNDVDVDGDSLTAVLSSGVAHGELTLNGDGSFTYVPEANFNGQDSFSYIVTDGQAQSEPAMVMITVSAVNDAPVATTESFNTNEDELLSVTAESGLLLNDTDIDADTLTATLVQAPPAAEGSLQLFADGGFIFTPAANFNGEARFSYQANDGEATSNAVTVVITIAPVNDAPVARADAFVTPEDSVLVRGAAAGLLANDTDIDAGDSFTVVGNTQPANGALSIDVDGAFTYTPEANFNGDDSFEYTIRDQSGLESTAVVSITVGGNNDAPVAVNDLNTTPEDTEVSGNVLTNDSDVDGEALTAQLISEPDAAKGSVVLTANGDYTFTPALNFNGQARFTYQALDPNSVSSNVAEVIITVSAVNDAPVAVNDRVTSYEDAQEGVRNIEEDTTFTIAAPGVLSNDTDVDSESLAVNVQDAPANGALELRADGAFTYAPAADFNGEDTFTYTVSDGELESAPATVTIVVRSVNDAPVAEADTYTVEEEGTLTVELADGLLNNDTDVDGDALSAVLENDPENNGVLELEGGVVTLNADGSFSFVAAQDFTGDVTFSYTANDNTTSSEPTTVTITVTPINDAPVAVADSYEAIEDTTLAVAAAEGVLANDVDVDGDVLMAELVAAPAAEAGVVLLNDDGSFTFEPAVDFTGDVSFTYMALDAEFSSETVTVTIMVLPTDDTPVPEADSYETDEDTTLEVAAAEGVLANDTDVDSDPTALVASLVEGPESGELTLNNDGSFTYVPAADANGEFSFTYSVSDGVSSAEGVATIMVNAINDAPTFIEPTPEGELTASEGVELSFVVTASDVDEDELSFSMTGLPASASLDSDTGVFSWTPSWEEAGAYTLVITVTDGELSESRELSVNVSFVDADEDGLADSWEESVGLSTESADSDGDGIDDATEVGDNTDEPSNVDGDDLIDALDLDSDDDGIDDATEAGDDDLTTLPVDSDDDGVADFRDTDSDDDGVLDGEDTCPTVDNDQEADLDGDSIGDACDLDLDGDGVSNELEEAFALNPADPDSDGDTINDGEEFGEGEEPLDSDEDGDIDALDEDSDNDGVSDADEAGDAELATPAADTDSDGVADFRDLDSDGDDVDDESDNCRLVANADQSDIDMNDVGDLCDGDLDGDGVDNDADNCPDVANEDQADLDGDNTGDLCDGDLDGDNVDNDADNCPEVANEDQADLDGDNTGDLCDSDIDGDSVDNDADNCPEVANEDQADLDGDSAGDLCDEDIDDDSVANEDDNCPTVMNPVQEDSDEDGIGDACDEETDRDSDGVLDAEDNCPEASNPEQADLDEDGVGDVCDDDADGDNVNDEEDNCAEVANEDQADADEDGIGDACDEDSGETAKPSDSGCDQRHGGELPTWALLFAALVGIVSRRRREDVA